jgi:hypothetical protein
LTTVGNISKDAFHARFQSMAQTEPSSYFIIVAEDKEYSKHLKDGY